MFNLSNLRNLQNKTKKFYKIEINGRKIIYMFFLGFLMCVEKQ